jgi:predicted amino acid-binding ACT domain protein
MRLPNLVNLPHILDPCRAAALRSPVLYSTTNANDVPHTLSSAVQRHEHEHILTLSCPDAKVVVFRVASVLFKQGCNILDSAQFCDPETGPFFMRVHVECPASLSTDTFSNAFSGLAESDQLQVRLKRLLLRLAIKVGTATVTCVVLA